MCVTVSVVSRQWDKVEDKYAVATIGVAAIVALWTAVGAIKVPDQHEYLVMEVSIYLSTDRFLVVKFVRFYRNGLLKLFMCNFDFTGSKILKHNSMHTFFLTDLELQNLSIDK